jgi:hypothetical protein
MVEYLVESYRNRNEVGFLGIQLLEVPAFEIRRRGLQDNTFHCGGSCVYRATADPSNCRDLQVDFLVVEEVNDFFRNQLGSNRAPIFTSIILETTSAPSERPTSESFIEPTTSPRPSSSPTGEFPTDSPAPTPTPSAPPSGSFPSATPTSTPTASSQLTVRCPPLLRVKVQVQVVQLLQVLSLQRVGIQQILLHPRRFPRVCQQR